MERMYFSAPGRTEIGGNHTDHQHGCALAAAIDLETTAQVQPNGTDVIRVFSEGYAPVEVKVRELAVREEEKNTTAALVRGVAAGAAARGCALHGFDAQVRSTVLNGSGLSSSAAFEVLMGRILNGLFCGGRLSAVEIAQIGQFAENTYFGKPCGLLDQMASSVGGLILLDFADPASPAVEQIPYDFARSGYTLCIIDSGAGHADLTGEYAAIPEELKKVCRVFGRDYLREVDETLFYKRLPQVREMAGDRAALRAMHVFDENRRVLRQAAALRAGNFEAFLRDVNASGESSWMYLQNVVPAGGTYRQGMAFTLALCRRLLDGSGAVRVHGGGFAGTALAFVPQERLELFRSGAEAVLGRGCCHVLRIV